ncbi:nucleotidyltransferase [Halalkalibacter krulwichiae]|uniref:tRNA(Met) cytidine acetate ligase n=1 Tax=Halalkalibacter krulwichiae TaxID=199441 RepID=A0A1X9MHT2_9BACI|nr:nucleotidyltransferase [Halalkalibacter krulwichiae]ARK31111.1 hypothetical protein BkAM31D_15345 [Halalkalibacter krulwichiae]
MKAVGIVVEYNPFHNGHLYQVEQAKQATHADVVIAIMSASFLQRGEPAIVSKWFRTEMALSRGVDIVLELPYIYSTQKAETFANGAIAILKEVGVEYINFGSESGDVDSFNQLSDFMHEHKDEFDQLVKKHIKKGYSYPRATTAAFQDLHPASNMLSLTEPNNILGFHYIKAIRDQHASIKATTTLRKQAQYHDAFVTGHAIASATSIRKALMDKDINEISHVMPEETFSLLNEYQRSYQLLHTWEHYFNMLQYKILSTPLTELRSIYECEEGLEYRMKDLIKDSMSFTELMERFKTKRYTWTRLQRLLTHILTNTTKTEMEEACSTYKPPYIRLLGMTQNGRSYLNKTKSDREVPIITKFSKASGIQKQIEERVTNIYLSPLKKEHFIKEMKQEFSRSPIILNH